MAGTCQFRPTAHLFLADRGIPSQGPDMMPPGPPLLFPRITDWRQAGRQPEAICSHRCEWLAEFANLLCSQLRQGNARANSKVAGETPQLLSAGRARGRKRKRGTDGNGVREFIVIGTISSQPFTHKATFKQQYLDMLTLYGMSSASLPRVSKCPTCP